jgi:hypothetical protein
LGKGVSVLIPSRNEFLLAKTIETTLEAAEGDIEIIAILDDYWPVPNIPDDPRVTLIHHSEPVGQRRAVNEAAEIAKGKYILKTDGHSTFDKGFDVKLAKDCEYDWTVLPRMFNLHAFDHVCKNKHSFYQDKFNPHKKNICPTCNEPLEIEYVWEPRQHKRTDFMYIDSDLRVQYWNSYRKRDEAKGDIVDVMNGPGACWFQHRDRFLELGGLDEGHGFWGQVGVEVACKAWLSGGRHVVNKKTWFSHMFRTTGVFGFPYKIRASKQEAAREYSRDLWLNNKWPLAKRKFNWLVEKFGPVPTWNGQLKEKKLFTDKLMKVDELFNNRLKHSMPKKKRKWLVDYNRTHPKATARTKVLTRPEKAIENFFDSFIPFIDMVLAGEKINIKKTAFYKYNLAHLSDQDLLPKTTKKGKRHAINKAKDAISLYKDIEKKGLKKPLDMWKDSDNLILYRGYRRLVIIKALGYRKVPVRIWESESICRQSNIVLSGIGRSHHSRCLQILTGVRQIEADVIYFAEHDVIYHPSHFDFVPEEEDVFYYNVNRWWLRSSDGQASHKTTDSGALSQLVAHKGIIEDFFIRRIAFYVNGQKVKCSNEPGKCNIPEMPHYKIGFFYSEFPNIDIRHKHNYTKSDKFKEGFILRDSIPGWGRTKDRFKEFLRELNVS